MTRELRDFLVSLAVLEPIGLFIVRQDYQGLGWWRFGFMTMVVAFVSMVIASNLEAARINAAGKKEHEAYLRAKREPWERLSEMGRRQLEQISPKKPAARPKSSIVDGWSELHELNMEIHEWEMQELRKRIEQRRVLQTRWDALSAMGREQLAVIREGEVS